MERVRPVQGRLEIIVDVSRLAFRGPSSRIKKLETETRVLRGELIARRDLARSSQSIRSIMKKVLAEEKWMLEMEDTLRRINNMMWMNLMTLIGRIIHSCTTMSDYCDQPVTRKGHQN